VPNVDDLLERWRSADVIDAVTADRIRAYERGHPQERSEDRPGVLEALVYLGLAIIAVGVAILVGVMWSDLTDWAKVAVLLVPGALAIVAGQGLRSLDNPGMRRGGHVMWAVATGLIAGGAAVWGDSAGLDGEDVGTVAALVAAAIGLTLWVLAPSHPQMLALGVALFALSAALGTQPDDHQMITQGLLAVAFGAAIIALRELRFMRPEESAALVGAALVVQGAFFAGFEFGGAEAIAFGAAAALVVLSIWHGVMIYMLAGVGLGFAALVRSIATHVEDPALASLALIVVGVLLIAIVMLITRTKPWRMNGSAA